MIWGQQQRLACGGQAGLPHLKIIMDTEPRQTQQAFGLLRGFGSQLFQDLEPLAGPTSLYQRLGQIGLQVLVLRVGFDGGLQIFHRGQGLPRVRR